MELKTQRLILREWRANDLQPFQQMNADPRVMEFFPKLNSFAETEAIFKRIQKHFTDHGYGLWAVELSETQTFIGFVGLQQVPFQAHFTPATEVGWRLLYDFWGKGYATEAAEKALHDGFTRLKFDEIVAMTAHENERSYRVMERLNMKRTECDDFDHPLIPKGQRFFRHRLYRLTQSDFLT